MELLGKCLEFYKGLNWFLKIAIPMAVIVLFSQFAKGRREFTSVPTERQETPIAGGMAAFWFLIFVGGLVFFSWMFDFKLTLLGWILFSALLILFAFSVGAKREEMRDTPNPPNNSGSSNVFWGLALFVIIMILVVWSVGEKKGLSLWKGGYNLIESIGSFIVKGVDGLHRKSNRHTPPFKVGDELSIRIDPTMPVSETGIMLCKNEEYLIRIIGGWDADNNSKHNFIEAQGVPEWPGTKARWTYSKLEKMGTGISIGNRIFQAKKSQTVKVESGWLAGNDKMELIILINDLKGKYEDNCQGSFPSGKRVKYEVKVKRTG